MPTVEMQLGSALTISQLDPLELAARNAPSDMAMVYGHAVPAKLALMLVLRRRATDFANPDFTALLKTIRLAPPPQPHRILPAGPRRQQ